ncbi:IclR family transcriptional regulator [Azoarcus sp. KH32C]|uniref:IclR family transcriptional regulator n=1 Tax=Azoarcus sp. KH32C TaxID=748247 RepID=UPI0002385C79|nr:IclR family transcriptional regulator [Azoarcus sp. KH32C]BAL27432.1 transcriptional regulator, IclR family [Azoarcus sp. KH32C]
MSSEGVASVERALTILDVFTDRDKSLTLTEISKRAGFYKSTTLRLAESLEKFGYLRRLDDGAYRLGPKPLFLGSLYQKHFSTGDFVPQVMRRMSEELREGISFFVRDDDRRVCLHRVDSPRAIRDAIHEGDAFPLNTGASGHVLLAFSGLTGGKYDQIRDRYYAISIGERDPETAAVSCPVFAVQQRLVGALSVSGPKYRLEEKALEAIVPTLQKYAAELTHLFGGAWPDLSKVGVRAHA